MSELTDTTRCESEAESKLGRAAFLRLSALSAVGLAFGHVPGAAAAGNDLAAFVRLSRVASGVHDLPGDLARTYYAALESDAALKLKPSRFAKLAGLTRAGGPTTLAELERSPAYRHAGGRECVQAIAAAWWSGVVPTSGGGQEVATFSRALVWREVHEPMTCQGATGSWAKPGRAAA